jgi:hypothetical protein
LRSQIGTRMRWNSAVVNPLGRFWLEAFNGAVRRPYGNGRTAERSYLAVIVSEQLEQAQASYSRLMMQQSKTPSQSADAEARLRTLVRNEPLVELKTKSQRLFL